MKLPVHSVDVGDTVGRDKPFPGVRGGKGKTAKIQSDSRKDEEKKRRLSLAKASGMVKLASSPFFSL